MECSTKKMISWDLYTYPCQSWPWTPASSWWFLRHSCRWRTRWGRGHRGMPAVLSGSLVSWCLRCKSSRLGRSTHYHLCNLGDTAKVAKPVIGNNIQRSLCFEMIMIKVTMNKKWWHQSIYEGRAPYAMILSIYLIPHHHLDHFHHLYEQDLFISSSYGQNKLWVCSNECFWTS